MRLAIMQPYFLPYIGYWQLMHAVDRFILYDDVQYIQRGWVNRNRILVNGHEVMLTVPLQAGSRRGQITSRQLSDETPWRAKLVQTVSEAYRRQPGHAEVMPSLQTWLGDGATGVADYLSHLITGMAGLLGLPCEIVRSSERHASTQDLKGQERILEICRREGAMTYVNPPGGMALYREAAFAAQGCNLRFLVPQQVPYAQRAASAFVPWLSIVDVLMACGVAGTRAMLNRYDLRSQSDLQPPGSAESAATTSINGPVQR
ncbi:MAG: WbqC family protein [Aquabacterium sp.]